jgi:cell envelope-related function transcriptional attenuator common domain
MRQNNENETRQNMKKHQNRHRVIRRVLLLLALIVAIAAGFTAFEMHRLNPENRFANLKVIGSNSNKYPVSSGTFNLLLIGSDARKGDTASHSDSMVLIHANLKQHTYDLISIPRDTRVYMNGYGYTKLTSVQYVSQAKNGQQQGILDAVSAVSSLTGVPINFYAETNYWGMRDMVNAIGGIDMNLPFNVTLTHPWNKSYTGKTYSAGLHSFDGTTVTELVHERYSLPGTDYGRQQLQEAALMGIAKKVMQPSNVTRLPSLAQSLSKFLVATNMSTEDMISAGLSAKGNFNPSKQIHYRQVKGTSVTMHDDVLNADNSQIILDKNQLQTIIQKYFRS